MTEWVRIKEQDCYMSDRHKKRYVDRNELDLKNECDNVKKKNEILRTGK